METPIQSDQVIPPANTPAEINIHLGYIRRDILDIKTENARNMQQLKDQIGNLNFVSEQEFQSLSKMVADHETEIKSLTQSRDTLNGKLIGFAVSAGTFSSIITIIISHYWK